MRAYVNELALAEACAVASPEYAPLEAMLAARCKYQELADALFCARGMPEIEVRPNLCLRDVGRQLPKDKRRLLFQWVDKKGPFLEDDRQEIEQDLFLFGDEEVTDLGLGEAARRIIFQFSAATLSPVHSPTSRFAANPLAVTQGFPEEPLERVAVPNYLDAAKLAKTIEAKQPPASTWAELLAQARQRFGRLCIGNHCDSVLSRQPYKPHQGRRILELLDVLQRVMEEMGTDGLSEEGESLRNRFFVGKHSWFSNESETRKQSSQAFEFPNPAGPGTLTCSWHGKISSGGFRLHFEWPVEKPGEKLRVAYIGRHLET